MTFLKLGCLGQGLKLGCLGQGLPKESSNSMLPFFRLFGLFGKKETGEALKANPPLRRLSSTDKDFMLLCGLRSSQNFGECLLMYSYVIGER